MWNWKNIGLVKRDIDLWKGDSIMEILNLVLFGCVFYLALIGIPSLCERKH